MEYTDARCSTCGTWRTTLVGYHGARVCLTCGNSLSRGAEGSALTRLPAGAWIDALWSPAEGLGPLQRRERLRGWLGGHSVSLPEPYLDVLLHCERVGEVRFALPIVTLSTWHPVGERSFSDGNWTLRLQQPVLGEPVDFLLQGPGASRALLIEIDDPRRSASVTPDHAGLRTLELQAAGFQVLRVPEGAAEARGAALRQAFMREALEVIERGPGESAVATSIAPAGTRRMWARHELVYDATGLPLQERRELVEDWLRSRGTELEEWQLDFVAHCERAAEVHFALPFLRLPNAEPAPPRTIHLDPWHTLTAQVEVDDHTVDFAFMTDLGDGREVVTTLVEIHPARGPRDLAAERHRLQQWERAGHAVVDLPAAEAASRGQRWADALLGELSRRRVRDAG